MLTLKEYHDYLLSLPKQYEQEERLSDLKSKPKKKLVKKTFTTKKR